MATTKKEGVLTYVDNNGDTTELYPVHQSALYVVSFDSSTGTLVTKTADYTG